MGMTLQSTEEEERWVNYSVNRRHIGFIGSYNGNHVKKSSDFDMSVLVFLHPSR